MKIEMMAIDKVIPYARNPRRNESAVDKVAASLKEFGWRQPIVCDKELVVIVGHTRLLAAKKLQMTDVPVHVADMTPAQAKAYRLADNRTSEFAEWDNDLLKLELADLSDMDFNVDLTGFSIDDITGLGGEVEQGTQDAEPQVDKAAELAVKWGVKSGQLWELGDHRILCGDSTKKEDVEKVLRGDKPEIMVTDPPYGVEYDADWRNKALRSDGTPIAGRAIGKVENDDKADWTPSWLLFPGDVAYIWHDGRRSSEVQQSIESSGFTIRCQIIWAKNMFAIGRGDYHWQHEPCWYAVRNGGVGHWGGARDQSTLWEIDKPMKSDTGHSTQKPVECMARPIRNHKCDVVYEPFSGSGTTIIACEQLGRKCRAIEINPGYVAVAIQRWADVTGKEPKLVS